MLIFGLLCSLSWAQQAGPPASYAEGWVWTRQGPLPTVAPLTGVAIGEGGWLVGDGFGGVFLSTDGGKSWREVLEGKAPAVELPELTSDEELLEDAQLIQSDQLQSSSGSEDGVDVSATTETASSLAIDRAGRAGVQRAAADDRSVPVWLNAQEALVARGDGIWRSRDGGEVFQQVSDRPASTLIFSTLFSGVVVAGTSSGVLYSFDGGKTWDDIEDATDGGSITTLAQVGGALYAGGDLGLFRTRDGATWEELGGVGFSTVQAILPDPGWEGGFWVANGSSLLRTDDDGASFYAAGRQPMTGLRGLTQVVGAHLLAWGNDGVWESGDGGVRWFPVVRLLTEPKVQSLIMTPEGPIITAGVSLWALRPATEKKDDKKQVSGLGLSESINVAWRRQGLDVAPLSMARRQMAALISPTFSVDLKVGQSSGRTASWFDEETQEDGGVQWQGAAVLCWGGCGSGSVDAAGDYYDSGGQLYDANGNVVDIDELGDELFVVGDQIFDQSQVVAAAANVAQAVQDYQGDLYALVAEAWITRNRLIAERPSVQNLSLEAQLGHELKILELEARLDIYTDGAFGRSIVEEQP